MAKATATPAGTIIMVDPRQLTIAANVRTDARVDDDFVKSIKELGILQPPMVTANDQGGYDVVLGQRRTLGAVAADLAEIPVYLVDKREAEAARVIDQLTENDQRQSLTDAERLGGYRELSLFGIKPADIVKRTARPKAEVDRFLKVLSSEVVTEKFLEQTDSTPITLEDAELLAEFDKDPETQGKLLDQVGTTDFKWKLQSARRDRDIRAAKAAITADLEKAGVRVITDYPGYYKGLAQLAAADDPMTSLTPEAHATCPGHVAVAGTTAAEYYCEDPEANGHVRREYGSTRTPEQLEQDRLAHEARAKAKADAEIAASLRAEFLRDQLLAAKPPADLNTYFAKTAILDADFSVDAEGAAKLLGIDVDSIETEEELLAAVSKNAKLLAAFPAATALVEAESNIGYLADRSGYRWEEGAERAIAYLQQLTDWGYLLSGYELALLEPAAGEADEETSAEDEDDTEGAA